VLQRGNEAEWDSNAATPLIDVMDEGEYRRFQVTSAAIVGASFSDSGA